MNQWTAYCQKHAELELVGDVTKVDPFKGYDFEVQSGGKASPPTRGTCEVWAVTAAGCKVHFIGGAQWTQ